MARYWQRYSQNDPKKLMQLFKDFKKLARENKLKAVQCTDIHWQLREGKFTVNYYPTKETIYVNGTTKKVRGLMIDAIKIATGELFIKPKKRAKRSCNRTAKSRLLRKDPTCALCKKTLTMETATLDHIIPISKGGADRADNKQLACYECNQKKGNEL